ncbi:calcium-binding protein CP1-like [Salvia splendens]|uniref:calcium-binding protein CP1-like n=1 Tax=Salvia splendens TaxID=180675 RepID=UPI001C26EB08|nr:calcium-binding protein CP1-like [Salvia splendens]
MVNRTGTINIDSMPIHLSSQTTASSLTSFSSLLVSKIKNKNPLKQKHKMCPTGSELSRTVEKSNLRSAFDVLDADADGRISHADLRAFYGGISGSDDDVIGSMISAADSNRDGFVEYEEFRRVLGGGKRRGGVNAAMEEAFRVMDKDGDGKVGMEDLKVYLEWAGLEARDEDVLAMIRLGGGDESGGVTFEGLLKILAV